jgi:hypothetical protein
MLEDELRYDRPIGTDQCGDCERSTVVSGA